jgi:hypothetical protein
LKLAALISQTEDRLRRAPLFYGHGTDNPHDEAAFLVLRGLGLPFDADLGQEADAQAVEPLVRRRIRERIPAAYLLKEAWLAGLPFYVDRRVIVPRSHIAELLAARMKPWLGRAPRRILDLCTGSGCLAILAAKAFPRARVDAGDVSAAALAVARRNVSRHKARVEALLRRHGLDCGVEWTLGGKPFLTQRGRLVEVVSEAIRRHTGRVPELSTTGGTSDARFIADICPEVVEFGPVNSSIHKLNEHIELDALGKLPAIYLDILRALLP